MTGLAALLESFDAPPPEVAPPESAPPAGDAAREAERLAAYESGYRSGWDDCLAAEREATRAVGAELARNLSDLGFTYHEARAQLLSEVEVLLGEVFATVLPRAAGAAMARMLTDDLVEMAAGAVEVPVEIVVSPADAPVLRALLPPAPTLPLSLVEETALAEGQAFLRFGRAERHYDLAGLGERLREALLARRDAPTKEMRHAG